MKKVTSILLTFLLLVSMLIPVAFASYNENAPRSVDDYTQYTITFDTQNTGEITSYDSFDRNNTEDTITLAMEFVDSLDLNSMGYSYIEDACLAELSSYKNAGNIQLEKYTVLVPTSSSKNYYGTVASHDFYYDLTSQADLRVDKKGPSKSPSNSSWSSWVEGAINLAVCFVDNKWYTIPFSLVTSALNLTGEGFKVINDESFALYTLQYHDVVTRSIYREDGSALKLCFMDQSGNLEFFVSFCPVGGGFKQAVYPIRKPYDEEGLWSHTLTKDQILQAANIQASHNSCAKYMLSLEESQIIDKWEKA